MKEAKKIKKFLRNEDNKVIMKLAETDPWNGERVLATVETYYDLYTEDLRWRQKNKCYEGCMDAPSLKYLLTIENKEGEEIYKKTFWKIEEVKDFLLWGFEGIVRSSIFDKVTKVNFNKDEFGICRTAIIHSEEYWKAAINDEEMRPTGWSEWDCINIVKNLQMVKEKINLILGMENEE